MSTHTRPLYAVLALVATLLLYVGFSPRSPSPELGQVRLSSGLWRSCDGPHAVFTNAAGAIAVLRDARGICKSEEGRD